MSVTLEIDVSNETAERLDERIDEMVEEQLDEVTGGTASSWDRQREKLSVDKSTVPGKEEFVKSLIQDEIAGGR